MRKAYNHARGRSGDGYSHNYEIVATTYNNIRIIIHTPRRSKAKGGRNREWQRAATPAVVSARFGRRGARFGDLVDTVQIAISPPTVRVL